MDNSSALVVFDPGVNLKVTDEDSEQFWIMAQNRRKDTVSLVFDTAQVGGNQSTDFFLSFNMLNNDFETLKLAAETSVSSGRQVFAVSFDSDVKWWDMRQSISESLMIALLDERNDFLMLGVNT
jgi:hypothetical protein